MARVGRGPTKKQLENFAAALSTFGIKTEDVNEAVKEPLYNAEQMMYEGQAVLNFFEARIKRDPEKKPGESQMAYEARKEAMFKEWNFKICKGCEARFAYAYAYSGVQFCSLDCLEKDLEKIGIKFSRHKDLRRRWDRFYPAVVSSTALEVLQDAYPETPTAFDD